MVMGSALTGIGEEEGENDSRTLGFVRWMRIDLFV